MPTKNQSDIKALVRQMAVAGAGRELEGGLPPGPWTPEQLADAISQLEGNSVGIDLRTVQLWFQENERGISAQNIHWLARIFGCGDPDAIREWQIELHAAQDRLNAKRRNRRKEHLGNAIEPVTSKGPIGPGSNIAQVCIGLFAGKSPVNLVASLVAGSVALGFLAYVLEVHDITYMPVPGVEKQVGYFWAPNWTLVNLVLLPAYLIFVNSAVHYWTERGQNSPVFHSSRNAWNKRVQQLRNSFFVIFAVSFGLVFLVQWAGVYLRALIRGDGGNLMMDWSLIALLRPEILSTNQAIILTCFASFYTAVCVFFYLGGLLSIFAVAEDFADRSQGLSLNLSPNEKEELLAVGHQLVKSIYRATIIGITMILAMKLQAVYLLSDASSISVWLMNDVRAALGIESNQYGSLENRALAHFTTFLLLLSTVSVFFSAIFKMVPFIRNRVPDMKQHVFPFWMLGIVALMTVNFATMGQITGFALFLFITLLVAYLSIVVPFLKEI